MVDQKCFKMELKRTTQGNFQLLKLPAHRKTSQWLPKLLYLYFTENIEVKDESYYAVFKYYLLVFITVDPRT